MKFRKLEKNGEHSQMQHKPSVRILHLKSLITVSLVIKGGGKEGRAKMRPGRFSQELQ